MHYRLLSEQEKKSYREKFRRFWESVDQDFIPPLSKRDRNITARVKEYERANIIVAEDGADLIGVVTFWEYRSKLKSPYIDLIAVQRSFRGRGIGKKLVKKAIKFLEGKGIKKIKISTNSANKKAQKLHSSLGFKAYRIKKNAKGKGIHKIYMVRLQAGSNA